MKFADLELSENVLRAVADAGYTVPTPIQEQAIPVILMGRDVLGCAQTGTGKTASFTLPMVDILAAGQARARMPRSLILEPTRELATQVAEAFETYGKYSKLSKALLIGGESMADQIRILDRGVDVLIATPGRLLDVFDRGHLVMTAIKILVIDEADRMLDMGFIPDVERIVKLVSPMRQTLLFSATMPAEIRRLASAFLRNPKEISVAPPSTPAETVTQHLLVVGEGERREARSLHQAKRAALRALIRTRNIANALIFCNRKRDVGIVERSLHRHGFDVAMLHGDMVQSARTEVLARFKGGGVPFLVCSDVAARGLDIAGIGCVINFDIPVHAEDYVHRIGRTGRAGREGLAFTIATPEDGKYVAAIERLIGKPIPRITLEGVVAGELKAAARKSRARKRGKERGTAAEQQPPPAEPAQPPPRATPAEPPPRAKPAGKRAPRDSGKPVVGMGDHVPAFMLREARLRKRRRGGPRALP